MGTVSLLLCFGAKPPAGRTATGSHLAQSLVDLGVARSAPGEPGLLVFTDPPFEPTLAGRLSDRREGDFSRLRRNVERLRKHAGSRALPARLDSILIAPEIAARSIDLGAILAGIRAGAPHARIEAALPARYSQETGKNDGLALARGRRDHLRACARADLVIGGAGLAALERCAVGLPQILIPATPEEARLATELDRCGAAMKLNRGDDIAAAVERVMADLGHMPAMIRLMSEAALDLAGTLEPTEALAAISGLAGVQVEKPSTISALRGSA